MCSDKNVLNVRIYGAEYSVRSLEEVNSIKDVAEYVDKRMREVDSNVRVDSSLKVAILASLNITDELLRERKEKEALCKQFEDKIQSLNALIDRYLSTITSEST